MDKNKLKAKMVEKNLSVKELSSEIGINTSTFYRKLNDGECFTIGETTKIAEQLELTAEEINHIFFAKTVA